MKIDRFMNVAYLSLVALALLGAGAGEAAAQALKPCPGVAKGTCVEFTVRYYRTAQKGNAPKDSPRIVIVGGDDKNACSQDPKNPLNLPKLCEASKPGVKQAAHRRSIELTQRSINPYCYQVCNDGWCWEECY